jgi:NodT family efflux transporter outer membrane factor (OMF) lipoprotein
MMYSLRSFLFSLACMGSLVSCTLTELPQLSDADVPENWQGPVVEEADIWPETDWWNAFNDEELSNIISQVQENNLDLENNRRNLESAQIALREAGFNLLPTPLVNLGTGASYNETRVDGSETSSSPNEPFSLGATFTYNDILSKPAAYDRAVADYDFRVAQVADVALNTLGTAASTYFQLLLTRDKVEASMQNVENAEAIYRIAQARVDAGVAVPIEALQQQIALDRERNNLRSFIQNDLATRSSLALLLGRSLQNFEVAGETLQDIEVPQVKPGLPSELLVRRPDLVQAEANLRSARASVDIVKTDLFPQISLTGGINASSTSLSELVSDPDTILNINANLIQTLLDNGQRFRNIDQARITMENNLNNYRRAVIGAFNEVEVLLSNIELLEAQGVVALQNLEAAEEAFRIAELRYQEGVADFQTVLIAQNTLFSTRNSYLDNKLLRLNTITGLFQALGGGWQAEE